MISPKLSPPLVTVRDQVLAHIDTLLAQPPRVEAKHFLILMDGVLLGGDQLLRALYEAIRARGWNCTEILPADVLWNDDEHLGWQACFMPFPVPAPIELDDCGNCFWQVLNDNNPGAPFFVFIEHLERFAIQNNGVQVQARRVFLAPLMGNFYPFPVFIIAQARHFPQQPLDYLKGFPLSSTTQEIPLMTWAHDEILDRHPQIARLDEAVRNEVLRLASGNPGIAARLADRVRDGDNLRDACSEVLNELMQGYDDLTDTWPDCQQELSRIVIEQANQIDILNLPPGGMFGPDPLRRLMRLCIIELNGNKYRVAAPFEQLLRGAL